MRRVGGKLAALLVLAVVPLGCSSDGAGMAGGSGGLTSLASGGTIGSGGTRASGGGSGGVIGGVNSGGSSVGTGSGGAGSGGTVVGGGAASGGVGIGGVAGRAGTGAEAGRNGGTAASGGSGGAINQNALPSTTLFLASDSTASPYPVSSLQQGWGDHLRELLIPKATIDNLAIGGRSIEIFMAESRWTTIQTNMKAGDFVMIDFGINDSGSRPVTPANFEVLLGMMVDTILAKRATPILVTPSALQDQKNGAMFVNTRLDPYCAAMRRVAAAKNILLDDLNAKSVANLNVVGQAGADMIYFNNDKAHFTLYGARLMARFIVEELTRIGSPLAAYRTP
jgi:lysophospholipase L1-like esterase